MTLHVVFSDLTSTEIVFTGDSRNDNIGSIGFDEIKQPGTLINSVSMEFDSTGAWNEVKEFDFSVPGAVPSIPEPST